MSRGKWAMLLAVVVVLGAVAVAFAAGKTSAPEVIRAQRFEVMDAEGRPRGVLGAGADGSVTLALADEKGEARASLLLLPDGSPALALCDEKGKVRATLVVLPDGSPSLTLHDEKGGGRAILAILHGSPALALFDQKGRGRAMLGATELVTPETGVGENRPESSLVLFNPEGKVIWKVP